MNQYVQNFNGMNRPNYQQTNGITWVQGLEGAKAFQLMPNSNAILMDSDIDGRFYIKTSDNIGICNLRIFDYVEVTEKQGNENFITREEVEQMIANAIKGGKHEQPVSGNDKRTIKQ